MNIYSTQWAIDCIAPRYRDLMEAQVVIHLARWHQRGDPIAASDEGARRWGSRKPCSMDADLTKAEECSAICRLTGYRVGPQTTLIGH